MKKVSFWSPFREKGGVTSNLLTIAIAINLYYHKKVAVRSNHISNRMIDYYLSEVDHRVSIVASDRETYSRDFPQYMHYLLLYDEKFRGGKYEKRVFGAYKDAKISLYRPPETYEADLYPGEDEEIFFLDLSGKHNADCDKAMEQADINVYFLPTGQEEIKEFFSRFKEDSPKALYIINGHSDRSEDTSKEIRKMIGDEFSVDKNRIMFIPYYERLRRACHLGEIDCFMADEFKARKRSRYFKTVKDIGSFLLTYSVRK